MATNKAPRYPLWSPKTILLTSIPVIVITAILVFWLSNRSIFVELQITLSLIAFGLFIFLTIGLYSGFRLEKPAKPNLSPSDVSNPTTSDYVYFPTTDLPKIDVNLPEVSDAGDDVIGCILSIVFWVVVSVGVVFILWLIQQLLVLALPALVFLLYWVFYRALRIVSGKSRICRGRLWLSLGYSLMYTALYVGWLFGVIWIGQYIISRNL